MSQVKNLRAMFENKGDKSPPDRGRSPGVSTSANSVGSNRNGSPRPLSKVRTNFVAIEKDGRIGLRRDHSGESSLSRRRTSIETDVELAPTFLDKPATTSSDDLSKPLRKLFVSENVSEPLCPPSDLSLLPTTAGAGGDKPITKSNTQTDQEQSPAGLKATESMAGSALKASGDTIMTPSPIEGRHPDLSDAEKSATLYKTAGNTLIKPGASGQVSAGSQKKAMTNGSQTAETSNEAPKKEDKSVKKSLETLGTRRGGTTATTRITTTTHRPRPRPSFSNTAHKLQPSKGTGHGDTAVIKQKRKSTTKSVNIPSSLTAPTASSVSKSSVTRQSDSRQSGSLQSPNTSSNSTTRAIPSNASASAQLAGRPRSALSRPKPSAGLSPIKSFQPDGAAIKRSSHVDEGFLARMMRPTQASSSKTAEKAPTTPPKKTVSRPSTAAAERKPRHAANARRPMLAKDELRGKSESSSSQRAQSSRTSVDSLHELSLAEPTDQLTGSPQNASGAQAAEKPESSETEVRRVIRVEHDDLDAESSPGAYSTEPQVQLQNVTSPTTCIETVEGSIALPQKFCPPRQPVQPVNAKPLSRTFLVDESTSELHTVHVTEGGCQADGGKSATHGEPPLVSPYSSEPSTPPADTIQDEELVASESVAEIIDNVSTCSAPDATDGERIDKRPSSALPDMSRIHSSL